jgi:hypothetical protein
VEGLLEEARVREARLHHARHTAATALLLLGSWFAWNGGGLWQPA